MRREAAGEGEKEGDQDHRERYDGEEDVGEKENPEIEEARGGMLGGEEHVAVQDVVGDVGHEERAGHNEGREHAVAVCGDLAEPDVAEADEEEDGAECVEDGIQRGEEGEVGSGGVDGGVVVDQPCEEDGRDCGDADDGGDDGGGRAIVRIGAGDGGHEAS